MALSLHFSIVSEDGASIYSASPDAAAELPSLDSSLRGAGKQIVMIVHLVFRHSLKGGKLQEK